MNEKKDIVMLKIKDFFENKDNRKLVRSVFYIAFLIMAFMLISLTSDKNELKEQVSDYKQDIESKDVTIVEQEDSYYKLSDTFESYKKKMKPYELIDLEVAQDIQKQTDEKKAEAKKKEEAKKKAEAEKIALEAEVKKKEEAEKVAAEAEAKKKAEAEKIAEKTETEKVEAEKVTSSGEFVNVIQGLNKSAVESETKERAESDWSGDYEMQDYQYNNQIAAYNSLLNLSIDKEYKEIILNKAANDWIGDYEMIQYQYDNQDSAYNWIQEQNLDTAVKQQIMDQSKNEWGSDYEMVKYQYENQIKASLN
ncbi:MAG: hypothetical protein WA887_04455 [Carnobacterium jeotgali]|uniref:hypothetical protein n=1 Tax=Carnobacterium jeotgali TaxID=545534 RepID=UPI003C7292B6